MISSAVGYTGGEATAPNYNTVCRGDGHTEAVKLRLDLMAQVGSRAACVVLRMATRHGRLHPGLAAPIRGPVVNSEKDGLTPPDELERMLCAPESSPYL